MPGGLRGWCGLWGTGCAAMREPYSKTHFYTYRLTSYLAVASGRWTARWCDEAGHAAPLGPAWSTHQASPNGLQRRAGATSDLVRPTGSKRIKPGPCRTRCDEVLRRHMAKSVPLDAAAPPLSHPELVERWKSTSSEVPGSVDLFRAQNRPPYAFERLISGFRCRSSTFISILINDSNPRLVTLPAYLKVSLVV